MNLYIVPNSTVVTLEHIINVINSGTMTAMSAEWRKAAIKCLNRYIINDGIKEGQLVQNKRYPDLVTRVINVNAEANGLVVEQIGGLKIINNMPPPRLVVQADEWELKSDAFAEEDQLVRTMEFRHGEDG